MAPDLPLTQIWGMSDENESRPSTPPEPSPADELKQPADELKAALGHLKSAAGLFFDRIQKDESIRKAAHDAEQALERAATGVEHAANNAATEAEKAARRLGERAQPLVKDLGSEISRLAKTVRTVLEPEPIPGEGSDAEPRSGSSTGGPNDVRSAEREEAETKKEEEAKDEPGGGGQPT